MQLFKRILSIVVSIAAVSLVASAAVAVATDVQPAHAKAKKQTIKVKNTSLSKLGYTTKKVSLKASAKTTLSYTSSNKKVATVSSKGKLKLKKTGTVKITIRAKATKKYKAAKKTVKVKVVRGTQVITTPEYNERLLKDGSFTLDTGVKGSPKLTFSSSNTYVATVTKKGKVKLGGYIGRTTITIKAAKTKLYKAAKKKVTLRVTRYLFMFEQSKNVATFSLDRVLKGLTGQRSPKVEGLHVCDQLTPQGACVDGNRLYITAYCYYKGHADGVKHNSVLYIVDKNTLAPIKAIVLPSSNNNHAGGVTVDADGNVWIAGSETDAKQQPVIFKETLDAAIADASSDTVVIKKYDKIPKHSNTTSASFVEYANGLLWIGNFIDYKDTKLYGYEIVKDGQGNPASLSLVRTYTLPQGGNGVSFFDYGSKRYLAFSRQVSGRAGYSEILFYEEFATGSSYKTELVGGASFPCQLEEIDFDSSMRMFAVYESAASVYRTGSDGNGVANEVTRYGTIGDGLAIFKEAVKIGPR